MGKVTGIVNPSKRSGEKNGKTWNIMTVEVEDDGKTVVADSFDSLTIGSEVVLTFNAEYKSYNAKLAGGNSGKVMDKLMEMDKKLTEILHIVKGDEPDEPTVGWD